MPNHCHNDLYINGPDDQVAALLAIIGADEDTPKFNFSTVIPYPEQWAKLDADLHALGRTGFEDKYGKCAKDGFNSGGYEWCLENWGTKWNAYEVKRRDYDGVCLTFQTAWSPPRPVILSLHKRFPLCTLHLEWFECGAGKCGGLSCLPEEDFYDEQAVWSAGLPSNEWIGDYLGHRGG